MAWRLVKAQGHLYLYVGFCIDMYEKQNPEADELSFPRKEMGMNETWWKGVRKQVALRG